MYKIHTSSDYIIRVKDGAVIPKSEDNIDYREYLEWVKDPGNTPVPADPLPVRKIEITALQIRKALNSKTLRKAVDDLLKTKNKDFEDTWLFSPTFTEDNPFILELKVSLGKTDAEMLELFTVAKSL